MSHLFEAKNKVPSFSSTNSPSFYGDASDEDLAAVQQIDRHMS